MRILVIGGTRFIGPPAVRRLAELGHEVAVFHRGKSHTPLPETVRHLHGDRKQLQEHAAELRDFAPEVVLDMVPLSDEHGTQLVSTFAGVARRLVVISSADVYRAFDRLLRKDPGPPDPSPLTEDSPLREIMYPYRTAETPPDHLYYSYDKILMEREAQSAPETLPATVLRLPMVYGPNDYQRRTFSYLKRMDDGRPFILLSEPHAAHEALRGYVEDIGEAIALCVSREEAAGRTYHVADRVTLTEAEWVRRIGDAVGWTGEIRLLPPEALPEHLRADYDFSQGWGLDSSRIRAELGYHEVTPPDEAMRRTIEWERANPPAQIDPAQYDYAAEDAATED